MSDDTFRINTWREAEYFAAGHMRSLGFFDAEVTPLGSDGGIDVVASGGVGQVKHYTGAPAGSPAVQQLLGASMAGDPALFYSLSGFTASAVKFANNNRVALFSYTTEGHVSARSHEAVELEANGFASFEIQFDSKLRDDFLRALQLYGQRVADIIPKVIAIVGESFSSHLVALSEAGQEDAATELQAMTTRELRNLRMFMAAYDGEKTHKVEVFLAAILRAESLLRQLASCFGADYDALASAAREARS